MPRDPVCGMDVAGSSALRLRWQESEYFFCSNACLEKFAAAQSIPLPDRAALVTAGSERWWANRVILGAGFLMGLSGLSYVLPALIPFRETLLMYFSKIWWAILLGLFISGLIDHFVPSEYISYFLARRKKRTILFSVFLGFLMSACNHGILALSMGLHKKGASNSSVIAFLLASPWANLPLTFVLAGFFGVLPTLYIVAGALVIAVTTGLVYQGLERFRLIEANPHAFVLAEDFSVLEDYKKRLRAYTFSSGQMKRHVKGVWAGMVSSGRMVLWWMLVGMGLAGAIGGYVPHHIFHQYLGPTLLGMLLTLGLAIVMEVCSEGSAPLSFELFRQTGALGNSFVFLMAGVATDYTEIGLIWQNMGKKTALWLVVVTVPQILFWGLVANRLFAGSP